MTMFYLTGAISKYDSHSQCLARVMVINDAHVYLTCVFLHIMQWLHIIKTITENTKRKLICQKYNLYLFFIFNIYF